MVSGGCLFYTYCVWLMSSSIFSYAQHAEGEMNKIVLQKRSANVFGFNRFYYQSLQTDKNAFYVSRSVRRNNFFWMSLEL